MTFLDLHFESGKTDSSVRIRHYRGSNATQETVIVGVLSVAEERKPRQGKESTG